MASRGATRPPLMLASTWERRKRTESETPDTNTEIAPTRERDNFADPTRHCHQARLVQASHREAAPMGSEEQHEPAYMRTSERKRELTAEQGVNDDTPGTTQRSAGGDIHLTKDGTLGGSRPMNNNISATMIYLAATMQDDGARGRTTRENIPGTASRPAGNNILLTKGESMGGSKSQCNSNSTTRSTKQYDREKGTTLTHDGNIRERVILDILS